MRHILRQREVCADEWRYPEERAANTQALIFAASEVIARSASFHSWEGRRGVRLRLTDAVEDLRAELPRLELVAIEFPDPGEGRGFSQGRLLRDRLGFSGELRAIGAAVKQDKLLLLARCGFDSFELAPGERLAEALRALERYDVAYQTASTRAAAPRLQRFSAPAG